MRRGARTALKLAGISLLLAVFASTATAACSEYGLGDCVERGTVTDEVVIDIPEGTVGYYRVNMTRTPLTAEGWHTHTVEADTMLRVGEVYSITFGPREILFRDGARLDTTALEAGTYVAAPWVCDTGARVPRNCRWAAPTVFTVAGSSTVDSPEGCIDAGGVCRGSTRCDRPIESVRCPDASTGPQVCCRTVSNPPADRTGICRTTLYAEEGFTGERTTVAGETTLYNWADGFFAPEVSSIDLSGRGSCTATLYGEEDLAGEHVTVGAGTTSLHMGAGGLPFFGDDGIDAIAVDTPSGSPECTVTLYEEEGFEGKLYEVLDMGWNETVHGTVRSVKIEAGGQCTATLWNGDTKMVLTGSASELDWGDRARSINVSRDCRATVYEHAAFGGKHTTFAGDAPRLAFDDRARSAVLKGIDTCRSRLHADRSGSGSSTELTDEERDVSSLSDAGLASTVSSVTVTTLARGPGRSCATDSACADGLYCHENVSMCVQPARCVQLYGSRDPERAVDVVFIGHRYFLDSPLRTAIEALVDWTGENGYRGLMSLPVWRGNRSLFNIYMVKGMGQLPETSPRDRMERFYRKAEELASTCPAEDERIVVSPLSFRSFAFPFRVAYISMGSKMPSSCPDGDCPGRVLLHEWGHLFGGLADEYAEIGKPSRPDHPNCANTTADARTWWGDLATEHDAVDYFEGCSYVNNNIRPMQNSLMRDHSVLTDDYGPVSERSLRNTLSCYRRGLDIGWSPFTGEVSCIED